MATGTVNSTKLTLTYEEALELLVRAVQEKGEDYVYPDAAGNGCAYFWENNTPACIVGHVLAYKGLTIEDVGDTNEETTVRNLCEKGLLDVDSKTYRLLAKAQSVQDFSNSWGVALTKAVQYAEQEPSVFDDV